MLALFLTSLISFIKISFITFIASSSSSFLLKISFITSSAVLYFFFPNSLIKSNIVFFVLITFFVLVETLSEEELSIVVLVTIFDLADAFVLGLFIHLPVFVLHILFLLIHICIFSAEQKSLVVLLINYLNYIIILIFILSCKLIF